MIEEDDCPSMLRIQNVNWASSEEAVSEFLFNSTVEIIMEVWVDIDLLFDRTTI